MKKLEIKMEKLPERCEICHQKDCFDAKYNYCSRCENVKGLNKGGKRINIESDIFLLMFSTVMGMANVMASNMLLKFVIPEMAAILTVCYITHKYKRLLSYTEAISFSLITSLSSIIWCGFTTGAYPHLDTRNFSFSGFVLRTIVLTVLGALVAIYFYKRKSWFLEKFNICSSKVHKTLS